MLYPDGVKAALISALLLTLTACGSTDLGPLPPVVPPPATPPTPVADPSVPHPRLAGNFLSVTAGDTIFLQIFAGGPFPGSRFETLGMPPGLSATGSVYEDHTDYTIYFGGNLQTMDGIMTVSTPYKDRHDPSSTWKQVNLYLPYHVEGLPALYLHPDIETPDVSETEHLFTTLLNDVRASGYTCPSGARHAGGRPVILQEDASRGLMVKAIDQIKRRGLLDPYSAPTETTPEGLNADHFIRMQGVVGFEGQLTTRGLMHFGTPAVMARARLDEFLASDRDCDQLFGDFTHIAAAQYPQQVSGSATGIFFVSLGGKASTNHLGGHEPVIDLNTDLP